MEQATIEKLTISSNAFEDNQYIPSYYTCDGENANPPLKIENLPDGTETLTIIVEDPDAPGGTFTHWIVWNIRPRQIIGENTLTGGVEGKNDFRMHNYGGPCPPSGTHRYLFKVYALDKHLHLEPNSHRRAVEMAMEDHIIGYGELKGLYKRER